MWYKKAAELGDKRAAQRLKGPLRMPKTHEPGDPNGIIRGAGASDGAKGSAKDKDCIVM